MNQAASRYRRQVRHAMHCSRTNQKKRLHDLDALLTSFSEENPDADIEKIVQEFGPPPEMAASLCEGISKDELSRWKRNHRILFGVCILLFACVVAIAAAHIALQTDPAPVQVIDELVID